MGMSRIFFDTSLFIYLIEDEGKRGAAVMRLLNRMSERRDELLTSAMTLGEVLVKPLSVGDQTWADKYERLLATPGVSVLPFDRGAAHHYALLRQDKSIKPPDAIQLACAACARCDLFITNDERLSRCTVPGIQFIASLDKSFL
jgi:predicted nucleic acid-binding protein